MNRTSLHWEDRLTVELRLRHWDGKVIGDALEEVRAHCAESGESPTDAFGDPADYAEDLAASRSARGRRTTTSPGEVLGLAGGLLGIVLAPQAAAAFLERGSAAFSVGAVLALLVALIGVAVLLVRPEPALRWIWAHERLAPLLVAGLPLALMIGVVAAFPATLIEVPWAVVAVLVVSGLAASIAYLWTQRGGDPVRRPVTGRTERPGLVLQGLTVLLFPILAGLVVGMSRLLALAT